MHMKTIAVAVKTRVTFQKNQTCVRFWTTYDWKNSDWIFQERKCDLNEVLMENLKCLTPLAHVQHPLVWITLHNKDIYKHMDTACIDTTRASDSDPKQWSKFATDQLYKEEIHILEHTTCDQRRVYCSNGHLQFLLCKIFPPFVSLTLTSWPSHSQPHVEPPKLTAHMYWSKSCKLRTFAGNEIVKDASVDPHMSFIFSWALNYVVHFSHLLFYPSLLVSQVISINKAINTQEVAVKEKHARNILTLSLCDC